MESMRVINYNCRGLPNHSNKLYSRPVVKEIFNDKKADIICFQETWYSKQDLAVLNNLHPEFHGIGESTVDNTTGLCHGYAPGGVAIMWRSSLDKYVTPLDFNINWLTGIRIQHGTQIFVILCVYMPYECRDNEESYLDNLGTIKTIIDELDCTCISILGDWNSDISDRTSLFGNHVRLFCTENNLILSSEHFLPDGTFTHYSEAWHTTSWLDHCISTSDANEIINNMSVDYSLNTADHLPLYMEIASQRVPEVEIVNGVHRRLAWDKINHTAQMEYCKETDANMQRIHIPYDALRCTDVNCKNVDHQDDICKFYDDIIAAMSSGSDTVFDRCHNANRHAGDYSIPGWNTHVDQLHDAARQSFKAWVDAGKPKHGFVFDEMKRSRASFKYELRFLKRHTNQEIGNLLAAKLQAGKTDCFWKEVRRMNNCKVPLPNCIDGISGAGNITELWRSRFCNLLNCIQDDDINTLAVDVTFSEDIYVTITDIESAIGQLDKNKSCGLDGIYAEHLKYCSRRILPLLAMCISASFIHGFLPDSMLSVVLVPVIKDKCRKINDSDNYRPIALASVISKVVEKILLNRMSDLLTTTSNQFGFKSKLGTDTCIYALKEIVENHRSLNGCMFMGFLDASKAFDRLKHSLLFEKLIDRNIPGYIIRIMMYWYASQTMYVRWSGILSLGFHVANGVRQGGILSPYLFNVYIDDLSIALSACHTGCCVSNTIMNHFMYADDLVIFFSF